MYRQPRRGGPPTWFVFLLGVALVFGLYYLWLGLRDFVVSGGLGIQEMTQQAATVSSATAERIISLQTSAPTARPTSTALPPCQEFEVIVRSAVVRSAASTDSEPLETLNQGEIVCVISQEGEWYLIDQNTLTRRLEPAYMREDLLSPRFPTPTPSDTPTLPPTITALPPSPTRAPTITPLPSPTREVQSD